MYTSFFGLNEKPFSITPDPRYLYMSERHAEALAHLIYGVKESGGFIQLTGEVGTGKTTLVRSLLQQLPDTADVAVVLNPQLSRAEFLTAICEELRVPLPDSRTSIKALTDALNRFLLANHARGRRTILIVDEAQNLRVEVLEQVRLLTNLETAKQKLLQIILIGQPELRDILARNDMRQLAQRITGRYHLEPLSRDEAMAYVDHRLKVAGALGQIFVPAAKRELYDLSSGVPRMINVIADRALLGAYTVEQHLVTPELVRSAATEVYGQDESRSAWWNRRASRPLLAAVAAAVVLSSAWAGLQWYRSRTPPPQAPAAAARTPAPAARQTPVPGSAVEVPVEPITRPPELTDSVTALGPILRAVSTKTGTDTAFARLFRLWGLNYEVGPKACQQAEQSGLQCLYQRGSLDQVRTLGRPVILTLKDSDSNPHQVVLSALQDGMASIDIGGIEYRVPAAEIEQFWFGEYLLLWRPRTSVVKSFFRGMRDPDVIWLRQSLAAIQGRRVEPMTSDLYDEPLAAAVRDYQRARRLPVDGMASQATLAAIVTDLGGDDAPRLSRRN